MFNKLNELETKLNREQPDIGHDLPIFCRGRLTLESGVPVSKADQAAKTTLYFTPYIGCYEFTEISIGLAGLTANNCYDIFYENHVLSATAWTNNTTRATALARVQGYLSLSTAITKRYVGTILMDAMDKSASDTLTLRNVWNNYNRITREMYVREVTSHTYNGAVRKWNNSDVNNLLSFVVGLQEEDMHGDILGFMNAGADASFAYIRPYLNGAQIRAYEAVNFNVQRITATCAYIALPRLGYNFLQTYEIGNHAASTFTSMIISHEFKG